jgi:hypothetical protein
VTHFSAAILWVCVIGCTPQTPATPVQAVLPAATSPLPPPGGTGGKLFIPGGRHRSIGGAKVGQEQSVAWLFENVGKDPLTVRVAAKSCNCTGVNLDVGKDYTIAPGDVLELKAHYKPKQGDSGRLDYDLTLKTSDRAQSDVKLTFDVTAAPKLVPGAFGMSNPNLPPNGSWSNVFYVASPQDFTVTGVDTSSQDVQASFRTLTRAEVEPVLAKRKARWGDGYSYRLEKDNTLSKTKKLYRPPDGFLEVIENPEATVWAIDVLVKTGGTGPVRETLTVRTTVDDGAPLRLRVGGRVFPQDVYEKLIKANQDRAAKRKRDADAVYKAMNDILESPKREARSREAIKGEIERIRALKAKKK